MQPIDDVISEQRHRTTLETPMQSVDLTLYLPMPRGPRRIFEAWNALITTLLAWQQRSSDRALFAAMTERELRDVGLARSDILIEADKPFWRA
jgi:uncharacterized protein YjiS (DUF1127 family)